MTVMKDQNAPAMAICSVDGEIADDTQIIVAEGTVWWTGAGDPDTHSIILYVILPFTYGEPILRGAISDTPDELEVSAVQGMLHLGLPSWEYESTVGNERTAVHDISARTMTLTKIVSDIVPAAGSSITVNTNESTGVVALGLEAVSENLIDAMSVNLDNAVESSADGFSYITLPAGRVSSFVASCRCPKWTAGTFTCSAAVFAEVRGPLGQTSFPAITVDIIVVNRPTVALPVVIPVSSVSKALPSVATTAVTSLYYTEVASGDRVVVTPESVVYLKFNGANLAYDRDIFRFGIKIYTT